MKKILNLQVLLALFLTTVAPLGAMADTILFNFTDTFTNGSTLNSATPANPTTTNTAYELVANKAWNPNPPTITANDLKFGIAATTSGYIQAQALFATNVIALVQAGDYIQLTVVFTNTSGLLTAAGQLGFGLYNSGQVNPVAGGINNSAPATFTGFAQNWVGYNANINFTGAASRISTRPAQSGSTIANQDLFTFGTSSSYAGGAVIGTATGNATLTAGSTYTEVFTITLNAANSLTITNVLYSGPNTSGTVITNFGAVATNTTFLTGGFDSLVIGYCGRANTGGAPLIDISSILVSGSTAVITQPPTITLQPISVTVATNGSCAFLVNAVGFDVTYQWKRNGTNLLNQGNISGANGSGGSSMLVVSPAGTSDVLSTNNGYYVTVSGTGGYSTNSVTNSLTLIPATNLYYANGTWDLHNSSSWDTSDSGNANYVFDYGDPVNFGDNGGGTVTLNGSYLSAASVTMSQSAAFLTWSGTGSFAGPGSLIYKGSAQFTIGNANAYTGGTIISNASAHLLLNNYNGLGTGPVTLALAGGTMDIGQSGSATLGINGDIVVADNFSIQFNGLGTFSGVFLGNLSGTTGKTLRLAPIGSNTSTNARVRVYGTNTTCNANLWLDSSNDVALISLAPYNPIGSQTYNGVISGTGAVIQRGGNGTTILNGQNTYSGGTTPTAGGIGFGIDTSPTVGTVVNGPIGTGPLNVAPETGSASGSGTVLAVNGARTIANTIQYLDSTNNQILIIGGTNALTFTGSYALQGQIGSQSSLNRTVQVNNTNSLTTISGVISDLTNGVSAAFGFTKTGSGVLALNNTETYTGPTTNSGGTLQVNGSLNAASAVTVSTNATLAGTGTINGPVTVNVGGAVAPGADSIGTLNINNNLTLSGNIKARVNRSGFSSDKAVVSGALTNAGTGTVTVANLGSALQVGDTFVLFTKPLINGSALTITGAGMNWQNNLAIDGTISVLGSSVLVPTNSAHVTTFSLANNTNVVINATNGQTGGTYYLLGSTNAAKPLSQWAAVATNIVNTNGANGAFTFIGTNVVGGQQQFYILSNTNNQ